VLLSQATVTYGHVLLVVVLPVRLALGAYVALALVRLAEVLPGTEARQLQGLAVLAGLATLVNVSGSALGGRSSAASTASVAIALVGLVLFARVMRSFTAHEPRTVTVVETWDRAIRWGSVAVAALLVGCLIALPALALTSGLHADHAVRGVVAGIGAVCAIAGIGALFTVARGTRWTRMAFGEGPDTLWHGPIVPGPHPPSA